MMLTTLASECGVSKSSLEAISDEKSEGRFGPMLLAKILPETAPDNTTMVVKVIRSPGDWNRWIGVLDVGTPDSL